jgi:hypothetical protein
MVEFQDLTEKTGRVLVRLTGFSKEALIYSCGGFNTQERLRGGGTGASRSAALIYQQTDV